MSRDATLALLRLGVTTVAAFLAAASVVGGEWGLGLFWALIAFFAFALDKFD